MKKITCIIISLTFFVSYISAQYPADMEKLLPDNVVVIATRGVDSYNVSQNKTTVVVTPDLKIFFSAKDAEHGEELWMSDGTVAGTHMVKDIYPGTTGSNPQWLCVVGNLCYFAATTEAEGTELWVTDGTEDGTKLVADIMPGAQSSNPEMLKAFGNKVIFAATDEESEAMPKMSQTAEKWIWVSDGTAAGTELIADSPLVGMGDSWYGKIQVTWDEKKAFFNGCELRNDPVTGEPIYVATLWVSDGTFDGSFPITINPDGPSDMQWLISIGNKVVFRANTTKTITLAVDPANASLGKNGDIGEEIWISDGTVEGTNWIGIDFAKGMSGDNPRGTQYAYTMPLNDHLLLFRADDGNGHSVEPCLLDLNKPFKDGATLATPPVPDLNPRVIMDVDAWYGSGAESQPAWPQYWRGIYDGYVYFYARGTYLFDPITNTGWSTWRCDVSSMDINTINKCEFVYNWTDPPMSLMELPTQSDEGNGWMEANGKLWFAAYLAASNRELWMMENNTTNPVVFYDFPGNGNPGNLTTVGDALIFVAGDVNEGAQYPSLFRVGPSPVGIQNIKAPVDMKVYPNPATDIVNILSKGTIQTVVISDIQGRKVFEQRGDTQKINVSSLKGGFYLINVKLADGSTHIQKLIVK